MPFAHIEVLRDSAQRLNSSTEHPRYHPRRDPARQSRLRLLVARKPRARTAPNGGVADSSDEAKRRSGRRGGHRDSLPSGEIWTRNARLMTPVAEEKMPSLMFSLDSKSIKVMHPLQFNYLF